MYAIRFNMYPGDARARWPSTLMTDARVAHYWDENRAAGVAYLSHTPAMMNRRAAGVRESTYLTLPHDACLFNRLLKKPAT